MISRAARKKLICAFLLMSSACASPEEQAAQAGAQANEAFVAGNYHLARVMAMESLRLRDDVEEHWMLLGRANMALAQYGAAYQAYSRALELNQANVEALHSLAQLALMGGLLDEAEQYAEKLLILNPQDLNAVAMQGVVALRRGNHQDALAKADRVLELIPLHEPATILRARALFETGQRAEAIAILERSLDVSGINRPKLVELVDFHRRTGDIPKLVDVYERLLQVAPDDFDTKADFASLLLGHDAPARAFEILAGLVAGPLDASQLRRVMSILLNADEEAVPREAIMQLAARANANVRASLASVALEKGYYPEAATLARPFAGQELTAQNSAAVAMYAAAEYHRGNKAIAEELANKVLAFDAANARALFLRASLSLEKGDADQALRDAQILVRDRPAIDVNQALLAKAYLAKGQANLALLTYRRAHNALPHSSLIAEEYSRLLYDREDAQAAIGLLRGFTAKNPESVSGWRALEAICSSAGNRECANQAQSRQRQL